MVEKKKRISNVFIGEVIMFKKDLVTVLGVYRKSNEHAYEVEAVDYLNVTKRDATTRTNN